MTLAEKKISVVKWVLSQQEEEVIDVLIKNIPDEINIEFEVIENNILTDYATKIESFDLEKVKEEQGFYNANEEKIERLVDEADIPQSIEKLLEELD